MTFSTCLPTTTSLSRNAPGVSSSPHQYTQDFPPTLRAAFLALFTAGMYVYPFAMFQARVISVERRAPISTDI